MRTITHAGRAWHYLHAIGVDSVGKGFRFPCSVAVGRDGAIFVVSRGMPVEPRSELGVKAHRPKIGKWSVEDGDRVDDFARNEFTWPSSVAVASDGNVYCCDEYENFIAVFGPDGPYYPFPESNPDGEALFKWGEPGSLLGQLDGPTGLMFDAEDVLYVVESRSHRVQTFTKEGRQIGGWGEFGSGEGQFSSPWGITIDGQGDVYVADWGNSRVQKFSPDGGYIMSFGSTPDEGGDLDHPADVAVDSDGDVYVVDWGNKRVQVFEDNSDILGAFYGDATEFSGVSKERVEREPNLIKFYAKMREDDRTVIGRFERPVGIAVDDQDRVYVVDSRPGRVQVYAKDKAYEDVPVVG